MTFNILNENYQFKKGDVISVFKIDNSNKKYIMYAVEDYVKNESKILVSYLEKDSDGHDYIVPIYDKDENKKVINLVKQLLVGGTYEQKV